MWLPWAVGIANSSITAYYANNFVSSDVVDGAIAGRSGHTLLAMAGATILAQTWGTLEWFNYKLKESEGKIRFQGRRSQSTNSSRAMRAFWYMLIVFYLVTMASAAMNVHLVTEFDSTNASVNPGGKLNGPFGNGIEALSYASLAIGGLAMCTFVGSIATAPKGVKVRMFEEFS